MNKRTTVAGVGSSTWTVTLMSGVYRYQCDPHHTIMRGRFTVS